MKNRRPDDIARHQIGRALNSAEANSERRRQRPYQQGFRHPGNAFVETVARAQDGREREPDCVLLPDDDGSNRVAQGGEKGRYPAGIFRVVVVHESDRDRIPERALHAQVRFRSTEIRRPRYSAELRRKAIGRGSDAQS